MLNKLIPFVISLREKHPKTYQYIVTFGKRFFGTRLGVYPRIMGNEIKAVTEVLRGSQWNMAYGKGLAHERLEADFSDYIGVPHAIAVSSGGIALQMSMRVLGIRPEDEVIHQVDTCSATAMSVMNAGATPIFADISEKSFMLCEDSIVQVSGDNTKALIGTHMWGNPENMASLRSLADKNNWKLIEDACLGLGATVQGKAAGSWGDVGVFSFGCVKPIQGGEGGMIVTHDKDLARELRAMRHWGDRTLDFGIRDVTMLSVNGRMPEIVAAVVREQLKGYPRHLKILRATIYDFSYFISQYEGIDIILGESSSIDDCAFTQVVLYIDEKKLGLSKKDIWSNLKDNGIVVWHASFEPINSLSLFKDNNWNQWVKHPDAQRINNNYKQVFKNASKVYSSSGLGLGKMNFLSKGNYNHLKKCLASILSRGIVN